MMKSVDGNVNVGCRHSYSILSQTTMHLNDFFLTTGGSRAATIALRNINGSKGGKNCIETGTCLVKNVLEALLGECGALDILDRTKFTCETLSLFRGDGPLLLPLKLLHHLRVIAQIHLGAHDEAWNPRAVMVHLREPLLLHVLKGRG